MLDTRTCAAIVDEYDCGAEGKGLVGFGQPGTCKWVEKAAEGKMKILFFFFKFYRTKKLFFWVGSCSSPVPSKLEDCQALTTEEDCVGYQRNIISGKGPCRWKDGPSKFY